MVAQSQQAATSLRLAVDAACAAFAIQARRLRLATGAHHLWATAGSHSGTRIHRQTVRQGRAMVQAVQAGAVPTTATQTVQAAQGQTA